MLFYVGLEEVIFSKHELLSEAPDELIIISGYLGPAPIERLSELKDISVTVIGGMYQNGIDARLLNSLQRIEKNNKNLSIKYTNQEIHSKIYIWKRKNKTLAALIGSANFSSNGLRTDYRESLADVTRDTFIPLQDYYNFIISQSTITPQIKKSQEVIDIALTTPQPNEPNILVKKYSYDIPLYSFEKGNKIIKPSSGLNWGRARLTSNAHVAEGDAYIPLPKEILKTNTPLIKPFDSSYQLNFSGKRKRNSDPIELIWDDGIIMEASLEGSQEYNGKNYPKQLASYKRKTPIIDGKKVSKKSILGRYLRKRLKIDVDEQITMSTLNQYGRDTITLSLISDGIYYADFSVKK